MNGNSIEHVRSAVDVVDRSDSRRVFATLLKPLGDFDPAGAAMHDAFAMAAEPSASNGPAARMEWAKAILHRGKLIDYHLVHTARDLNTTIQLMSKHPGVRFGPFETCAADGQINDLVKARKSPGSPYDLEQEHEC